VLASVVALVLYVHHDGQSSRVAGLIDLTAEVRRADALRLLGALTRVRRPGSPGLVWSADGRCFVLPERRRAGREDPSM
jgi:hypothetical protein